MDLATLKALKPAEYSEAADGYRSTAKMANAAKDDIENQIAVAMRTNLKGKAQEEASKQVALLGQNFHYIQTQCGLIGTALEAFSYELEAARRKLDTALAHAKTAGLTVNPDGSVTYPAGGEKSDDGKTPPGGTVSGLTDGTASAVGRQAARPPTSIPTPTTASPGTAPTSSPAPSRTPRKPTRSGHRSSEP